MKKIIILSLLCLNILSSAGFAVAASEGSPTPVNLYFFYGSTCPHCEKAEVFLKRLGEDYPQLQIKSYEVFDNRENAKLLLKFFENCNEEKTVRVPAIFIGQEVIIGYLNDETSGKKIEQAVINCLNGECPDPLKDIDQCDTCDCQGEKDCECEVCSCQKQTKEEQIVDFPLVGKINLNQVSLPVLTLVVGALDGFNPCAMWVLLFLLALLINIQSRKKMFLVGGIFVLSSGIIYFLLLSAWLNLFLAIGYTSLIRILIGMLAFGVGIWQMNEFITYQPNVCKVTKKNGRLKDGFVKKAEEVVKSTVLPATILGVIVLALGVNLLEFFCSAGLPAIYTQILSLNHLSPLSYYLYLLFYTLIFVADDIIVFLAAFFTLKQLGAGEKYNKWATLFGGILILILGVLLVFKPQWLMFG